MVRGGDAPTFFFVRIVMAGEARATLPVPADNEWFELEVRNDRDPMEVVSVSFNKEGWKYLGPKLAGRKVYRAKLVRLGLCLNLAQARKKADELGLRLLEGQAREAFKVKYFVPDDDNKDQIVFGGSEWRHRKRSWESVIFVEEDFVANLFASTQIRLFRRDRNVWHSSFSNSDGEFYDGSRWAVVEKNA